MSVVDTNVLVHSTALRSPAHLPARDALARLNRGEPVCVTRQVLREYISATTREQSWSQPFTLAEAIGDVERFIRRFRVLDDGPPVWAELIGLSRRFDFAGKQAHDANIVATMLAHGETRLLTFNAADFRRFGSVVEVVAP